MQRIRKILEWFLDDSIMEAVIGDLFELYDFEKTQGKRFTSVRFSIRALGFIRKSLYKKTIRFTTLTEALVRSSLSMSSRRLLSRPLQSLAGFIGLILGVLCLSAIVSYIAFSYSFDQHFSGDIHRIVMDVGMGDVERKVAVAPAALQQALVNSGIPSTRLRQLNDFTLSQGKSSISSSHIFRASPEFIHLFEVEWNFKAHDRPLTEPKYVYVSQSYYNRLDHSQSPVSLMTTDGQSMLLGGVFEDFPASSHIRPEVLVPIHNEEPHWMDWNWITYAASDHHKLSHTVQTQYAANLAPQMTSRETAIRFQFQPIDEVYFSSPRDFDSALHAKKDLILGLCLVACLIGCLTFSNYIFQVITRYLRRKKELQVRNIVGAHRTQQQWIFGVESSAELFLVFMVSVVLLNLNVKWMWVPVLVQSKISWLALTCGALWGLSLLLVRFIKGSTVNEKTHLRKTKSGQNWAQFALLWFQFMISMGLLTGMLVVTRQIEFLSNLDPGFQRDRVIDFSLNNEAASSTQEAINTLRAFSSVEGVATSVQVPGSRPPVNGFSFKTEEGYKQQVISQVWVDDKFFEVLSIPILAGQSLSPVRREALVVNQQFVLMTGLSVNELINTPIHSGDEWSGTIVGVVQDFHFSAMDQAVEPMVYRFEELGNHLLVRISDTSIDILPDMLFVLNQLNENLISDYSLLKSNYEAHYIEYKKQQELLKLATLLAFVLTSMGLWSSILLYATRRQKSLSLHKVHGAPMLRVWWMLFAPFIYISATSVPVAIYAAYIFGQNWLDSFPYRVDWPILEWLIVIGLVLSGLVATLLLRSRKIWAANPAHILRSE